MSATDKTKHNDKIDETKLSFACGLIKKGWDYGQPFDSLNMALEVMQYGGITIQDMLDWIEATDPK